MTRPECPRCKRSLWPGYDHEYLKFDENYMILECSTCDWFVIYKRVIY